MNTDRSTEWLINVTDLWLTLCCWNIRLRASTYCSSRSSNDLLFRSSITMRSDARFWNKNENSNIKRQICRWRKIDSITLSVFTFNQQKTVAPSTMNDYWLLSKIAAAQQGQSIMTYQSQLHWQHPRFCFNLWLGTIYESMYAITWKSII